MTWKDDLSNGLTFSIDYLWRYVVAGLAPLLLATLFCQKLGLLLLLHVLSAILIFPGAVVVNFAGQRFFPERTWTGDLRRPRLAGWLAVPVIWSAFFLSARFDLEPRYLQDKFGTIEGWIIHVAGLLSMGSTLALSIGWALPPAQRPGRRGSGS